MNSGKTNRYFLITGIITFLLGILMTITHIKYGPELVMLGVVLLCLRLIPQIISYFLNSSQEIQSTTYPDFIQSFGITAMIILAALLTIKTKPGLDKLFGNEASMLIRYLLINGIPLWIAYLNRKRITNLTSFNLTLENKIIIPFLVVGALVLIHGIAAPIQSLIPVPEGLRKALLDFGSQTGILTFILLVIAAPVLEELIFRGIILDGLLKKYSPLNSILISSFFFGLSHLNPWQFILGFLLGIFSGWVYYRTRSILPSIIIHATANFSGYLLRVFINHDSIINDSLIQMYGGLTNFILIVVGSIIIAAFCIYFLRKEFERVGSNTSPF